MRRCSTAGSSLIDVIVSIGIIALLFSAIYAVYFSLIDSITSIESRSAASSALQSHVERIRGLPYESVGTIGGIPAGVIAQQESSTVGSFLFNIKTIVRNIDDPFDGTIGGAPNDTAPADYKQVTLEISCLSCVRFVPLQFTTIVSPKNLENTATTGSLFINVFDSSGIGVSGASVRVVNASVTPAIDLTDTTNASGSLQLVGVATSSQGYQIFVSKHGYSSQQTYPLNESSNPNPLLPDATVVSQAVTTISFSIDLTSRISITTYTPTCQPVFDQHVLLSGSKLIGSNPDILKFSTTTTTGPSGNAMLSSLEWDTYLFSLSSTSTYDLVGMSVLNPFTINPASDASVGFTLLPSDRPSLSVAVKDATTGLPIPHASVTLSKTGYTETIIAGRSTLSDTTWNAGSYVSQSGTIDAETTIGSLLLAQIDGAYPTSTSSWLISETLDFGSSSSVPVALKWSGSQPQQTSVLFQIAVNNDNATWNFVGPTGPESYFTEPESVLNGFSGYRYARYKVFLSTTNSGVTPSVESVSIDFSGPCISDFSAFFSSLPTGAYMQTVAAPGYQTSTSSVSVPASSWQESSVALYPL
ncbi:MAG: hypothetical protein RIQ54_410 [Candidatus Parcubacteria bacterium]|jgi:hypothetical protein